MQQMTTSPETSIRFASSAIALRGCPTEYAGTVVTAPATIAVTVAPANLDDLSKADLEAAALRTFLLLFLSLEAPAEAGDLGSAMDILLTMRSARAGTTEFILHGLVSQASLHNTTVSARIACCKASIDDASSDTAICIRSMTFTGAWSA